MGGAWFKLTGKGACYQKDTDANPPDPMNLPFDTDAEEVDDSVEKDYGFLSDPIV